MMPVDLPQPGTPITIKTPSLLTYSGHSYLEKCAQTIQKAAKFHYNVDAKVSAGQLQPGSVEEAEQIRQINGSSASKATVKRTLVRRLVQMQEYAETKPAVWRRSTKAKRDRINVCKRNKELIAATLSLLRKPMRNPNRKKRRLSPTPTPTESEPKKKRSRVDSEVHFLDEPTFATYGVNDSLFDEEESSGEEYDPEDDDNTLGDNSEIAIDFEEDELDLPTPADIAAVKKDKRLERKTRKIAAAANAIEQKKMKFWRAGMQELSNCMKEVGQSLLAQPAETPTQVQEQAPQVIVSANSEEDESSKFDGFASLLETDEAKEAMVERKVHKHFMFLQYLAASPTVARSTDNLVSAWVSLKNSGRNARVADMMEALFDVLKVEKM